LGHHEGHVLVDVAGMDVAGHKFSDPVKIIGVLLIWLLRRSCRLLPLSGVEAPFSPACWNHLARRFDLTF